MPVLKLYQFYAKLMRGQPCAWRRFQVQNTVSMAKLGYIIMVLFEMKGNYRFCFDVPYQDNLINAKHGDIDEKEFAIILDSIGLLLAEDVNWHFELPIGIVKTPRIKDSNWIDATEIKIGTALCHAGDQMTFLYDAKHPEVVELILEEVTKSSVSYSHFPHVLAGEGDGLRCEQYYLTVLSDNGCSNQKLHNKTYASLREISHFNLDDINYRVKRLPRIYAETYEYGAEPTKYFLNLLERKYLEKTTPNALLKPK